MASSAQDLTRTERNLWSAIAGEALAYLKYNAFAHKALEEGYPEVAQVFQEVAGAETIHGLNHLNVAGEVKDTMENLRSVIEGEAREFSTMYPRMIRDAQSDGRQDAADSFALALEREQHHQAIFSRALEQMEARQSRAPAAQSAPTAVVQAPSEVVEQEEVAFSPDLVVGTGDSQMDLNTYVAATIEVDKERFRVANLGRLREVVFGAQDGILSTVALVTSVAVAIGDGATILVAGLAAALAGMISMATGAYLGSRAEQDVQRAEIAREARELEENPAEEFAELVVILQREGRSFEEANTLASEIAQDKEAWLRTLVEKELGISSEETTSPVKDALVMGVSFVVAAAIPIVPYLFMEGPRAIAISIAGALVGLFVLGMGKGRLVSKSPLLQGLEILVIGVFSAAIGFALGDLVPRLFS
ncbi:MAG: VIT1/CCC1 transporter family protein [Chloroflexi bacterium]|nr:VIT1/CCC1 transporter family protein [Chloroflexota bacterium]